MNVNYENGCNCGEQADMYNQLNTATGAHGKRIPAKIKVMSKSSMYFFINSSRIRRLHAGTYCKFRRGRCWKIRGGSEREMAILRTGKQKRGKEKFGDGKPVGRMLWGLRLFLHGVLRGARGGLKESSRQIAHGKRGERRAGSGG